ncbi:hypothetical protein [Actinokineospora cianjurensis]|uniref:Uncharacterized protein n=1 Tax=Actinokineospora cianjurensis TaxID=585224 RepID=A0A421B8T1_9PSEU|nr:hypothetical protein [Actinokineospora cianjurensis]RLK60774.1 hypothetical protein CLV68_1287 [Actinokineospora cianjurensis]
MYTSSTEVRVSAGLEVADDCPMRSFNAGEDGIAIVLGDRDGVEMVYRPESLRRLITVATEALAAR